jgi:hypothetical protein
MGLVAWSRDSANPALLLSCFAGLVEAVGRNRRRINGTATPRTAVAIKLLIEGPQTKRAIPPATIYKVAQPARINIAFVLEVFNS